MDDNDGVGAEAYCEPITPNCRGLNSLPPNVRGLKLAYCLDIFLTFYDVQKAYCAKRCNLRCYSIVPTLSPNNPMA